MHSEVLEFWFREIDASQWFAKDDAFDQLIADRFADIHSQASRCELYEWRTSAHGRLAEIIVLDQFSRNIFRGRPDAFATDALALSLAQMAISVGADNELNKTERNFLYMPFMHSESHIIHRVALALYEKNGVKTSLDFEKRHKDIIGKFGRYPHRNAILGRESTPEELEFLKQAGSGF